MRVTNNLGAVAALRGDLAAADTLYRQARSLAGDIAGLAADRQAIDRNLDGLKSSR
jgi:Flp pilus assembly protein TadD